ncbi:MAG: quinolinate synthase NadA [Candidatus Hodarchaeales archaeon]
MSQNLIDEINKLKKEKDAILLVHNYQDPTIQKLSDFTGDSLELSRKAKDTESRLIIFAGAEFMAETAAILNPDKKVIIPTMTAKCPMAHMLSPEIIKQYRTEHPDAVLALYVNTTAETKALADVCITSGNAVNVVSRLKEKEVLVGPDRNLAWFIQQSLPEKKIIPIPKDGHCYVHQKFTTSNIEDLKKDWPEAQVIVHPETDPSVQKMADKICSTFGMIKEVSNSKSDTFIIATEIGLVDRLIMDFPNRKFIPARNDAICIQQKKITLYNLYLALLEEKYVIKIPEDISSKARKAIERMLSIS